MSSPSLTHRPQLTSDEALCLIVRLQSETNFVHVISRSSYIVAEDQPTADVEKVACLRPSDTAGLRHVDLALDAHTPGKALVVDECGGLWLWTETRVRTGNHRFESRMNVVRVRQAVTAKRNSFFRIAWSIVPGHAVILSRRELILLNLETGTEKTILAVQGRDRVFTSLDKTAVERGACYTAAATTYEVIWADEHAAGTVMSWAHEHQSGTLRDLEVAAVDGADEGTSGCSSVPEVLMSGCFLLSSRSASLLMVLHGPTQPPAQAKHHPYALPLPQGLPTPLSSMVTLSATADDLHWFLLGASPEGSLWCTTVGRVNAADLDDQRLDTTWNGALRRRMEENKQASTRVKAGEDVKDVAETQYKELDLRWAWLGECDW